MRSDLRRSRLAPRCSQRVQDVRGEGDADPDVRKALPVFRRGDERLLSDCPTVNVQPEPPKLAWSRAAATLAIAAPLVALLLVVILHVVQSETNDNDALSEYALGDYGWLMNTAFFAVAVGFAALAVMFRRTLTPSRSSRVGIALLSLGALGWVLLGAGNIDPEGAEQTFHGLVHGVGFLIAFPTSFAAPLVLATAFRHDQRWNGFRRTSLVLGVVALVVFVAAFMDLFSAVTVRLAEALLLAWVALAGWRGRGLL